MGAGPSWYCVKIYPELAERSVQQVEDDDAYRSIYRFTLPDDT